MITKNINFKNFKIKKKNSNYKEDLKLLLREKNEVISTKGLTKAKKITETDYQLARAVDLLKGLALLKNRLIN